jgi:hypothetical protein
MNMQVKGLLDQLEEVREQLLAFADDVFHSIDHRNPEQLSQGVEFIRTYNDRLAAFDLLAAQLSGMIQQFTHVSVENEQPVQVADRANFERITRELDTATPHYLVEDFTYKRPYGFILRGVAYKDILTWKHLYEAICRILADLDPSRWAALPDNPGFTSAQNRKAFSRDESDLRGPLPAIRGIYPEAHYSANSIRDNIVKLLREFGVNHDELRIYLRQDRDARADVA